MYPTGVEASSASQEALLSFSESIKAENPNQELLAKFSLQHRTLNAQAIQSKGFATQSEAYRMLDEEIKGGTLQEINRGSEN